MDNITAVTLDKTLALRPKPGLKINGKDMFNPKTILHNLKFDTIKDKALLYNSAGDITPNDILSLTILNMLKVFSPRKLTVIFKDVDMSPDDYCFFTLGGEYYNNFYTYDLGKYDVKGDRHNITEYYDRLIFTQKDSETYNSGLDIVFTINEDFLSAVAEVNNTIFPGRDDYEPTEYVENILDMLLQSFSDIDFFSVAFNSPVYDSVVGLENILPNVVSICLYDTLCFTHGIYTEDFMLEHIIDETFALIINDIDEDALTFNKEEILDIVSMDDDEYENSDYYDESQTNKSSRGNALKGIVNEIYEQVAALTKEYGNSLGDGHYDNHNYIGLEKYLLKVLNEHFIVDDERTYENDHALPVSFEFYRHGYDKYSNDPSIFDNADDIILRHVFAPYEDTTALKFNETEDDTFEEFLGSYPDFLPILNQINLFGILDGYIRFNPSLKYTNDVPNGHEGISAIEYRTYKASAVEHKTHISREYLTVLYRTLMHSILSCNTDISVMGVSLSGIIETVDNDMYTTDENGHTYMVSAHYTIKEDIDIYSDTWLSYDVAPNTVRLVVEPYSFVSLTRYLLWNKDRIVDEIYTDAVCCNTAKFLSSDERYFYTCYTPRVLVNGDVPSPWFDMATVAENICYCGTNYEAVTLSNPFSIAESLTSGEIVVSEKDNMINFSSPTPDCFTATNKMLCNYYYTDVCHVCSDQFDPEVDDYDDYIQKTVYELYDMSHNKYDDILVHLYKQHWFDYPFKSEELVVTEWDVKFTATSDIPSVANLYTTVLNACGFLYPLTFNLLGGEIFLLQSPMIGYSPKYNNLSDIFYLDDDNFTLADDDGAKEMLENITPIPVSSTNYYVSWMRRDTGIDIEGPDVTGIYESVVNGTLVPIKYKVDIMSEVEYYDECLMSDYKNKYPRIERELPGIHYGVKGINWII